MTASRKHRFGVRADARDAQVISSRVSKVFFACILALVLSLPVGITPAFADVRKADIILGVSVDSRGLSLADCPSVDAEYAGVMAADGTLYFERNSKAATQIASITKVMTAIIVLENTDKNTLITVSERAAYTGESSAELLAGDVLTRDDTLKALLLSSGNDAAVALAEAVGYILLGGANANIEVDPWVAEQAFIDRMNERAQELGLVDTCFENPHGLDDDGFEGEQRSCALDVARMVKFAMENETFRSIVATAETDIEVIRAEGGKEKLHLESTDQMLGNFDGACGVKTGFTDLAGPCFAGAANREGEEYYAVVLDSSDADQRFVDAQILLQWIYDHQVEYPLAHSDRYVDIKKNGEVVSVPVVAEVA
ncbi:MAG: hypothetical protein LBB35_02795, partial [Coriobacteriaceae bacterium]|nr:hypothetical protein [Coriobacteriaceae bacterium]